MIEDVPSAGRFDRGVHVLPVRVYYEDTDFTGFVYHANYLRYFERARSDFLRSAGISHAALLAGEHPTAFAVTHIDITFRKPARVDDALLVRTAFLPSKGARLPIRQAVLRGEEVLAEANVEVCCIDVAGRPKKPPSSLVTALQPFLEG